MGGKQCFRRGSIQTVADGCSNVEYICKYFGKPGHLKLILRTKKRGEGEGTAHSPSWTVLASFI